LFYLSVLFFFLSGCQTVQTILKPALSEEGEIYVYIRSLPQEASGLRFTLEEISLSEATEWKHRCP
jgi:hemerythrin superfamily protein